MTHARKVDAEHSSIRAALRLAGLQTFDCARLGLGFPDLVVVHPQTGRAALVYFVEVKSPDGRFTDDEIEFMLDLVDPCYRVLVDAEQAVEILGKE